MIARVFVLVLLVVTAAAVQTAVLPLLSLAGFRPDLLLLLVIGLAVHDGAETGVRVGFTAGLLSDLLVQTTAIGVGALTFSVVGYLVGLARPYLAPQSITAPLLLSLLGSVVGASMLGLLGGILGDATIDVQLIMAAALFTGVVHTLLITPMLRIIHQVSGRFPAEGTAATR